MSQMLPPTLPVFNPRTVPAVTWQEYRLARDNLLNSSTPHALPSTVSLMIDWQKLAKSLLALAWPESMVLSEKPPLKALDFLWHSDTTLHPHPRPAAVLILLIQNQISSSEFTYHVVMTQRAAHLKHHPGQVSFVGGRIEQGETAIQAALREAQEEIGLDTTRVQMVGEMPKYHTITGFVISPLIAWMSQSDWQAQSLQLDANEVAKVFTIPLVQLFDVQNWRVHTWQESSQQPSRRYLSMDYTDNDGSDYFIWGASMAMTHNLRCIMTGLI